MCLEPPTQPGLLHAPILRWLMDHHHWVAGMQFACYVYIYIEIAQDILLLCNMFHLFSVNCVGDQYAINAFISSAVLIK